MAKQSNPTRPEPATIVETDRSPAGPRTFLVKHKDAAFAGELHGLKFAAGVCETQDAIKAHGSQELGCTVIDKATGLPAWPVEK